MVPRQLKYASELLQACRRLFTGLDTPLLHFTDFLLQVGLRGCGVCKDGALGVQPFRVAVAGGACMLRVLGS